MNKSVMNAIELLSAKYNFSVDEAKTLFTTKPKKKAGQSLQDMFTELVNDVENDERSVVVEPDAMTKSLMALEHKHTLNAMKQQKEEEQLAAKAALLKQKEEAKATLLKQKEEAKVALLKQKEEEKLAAKAALLKQKEEEKLAAKEALKKQKAEEKAAAKEALKKQKAEEKAALKEPKVKVAKAKKEKADPPAADAAELPPVKVTVTRIKIDDQTYLKSAAGILYNVDTKEEVGLHDEATNTIKPLPDEEEEELEEDEYAEDEYAEDN